MRRAPDPAGGLTAPPRPPAGKGWVYTTIRPLHFRIWIYALGMESTNQTRLPAVARAHCDIFRAGLPWPGMAKLYKGSIFCHHGDTICHPKSGYVTTKLHGTSTCGCNNNAMFSGRAIFTFPTAVVCWPC